MEIHINNVIPIIFKQIGGILSPYYCNFVTKVESLLTKSVHYVLKKPLMGIIFIAVFSSLLIGSLFISLLVLYNSLALMCGILVLEGSIFISSVFSLVSLLLISTFIGMACLGVVNKINSYK